METCPYCKQKMLFIKDNGKQMCLNRLCGYDDSQKNWLETDESGKPKKGKDK